jgi:ribosomal protein L11 methyltransferase
MWVVTLEGTAEQAAMWLCEEGVAGAREEELPDGRVRLQLYFEEQDPATGLAREARGTVQWAAPDPLLAYQQEWTPVAVGHRFFLRPPWVEADVPEGRIELLMQPGTVFGSGDHPTTQLCLTLLEEYVTPGDIVVDAGTGTGILAIAAKLLGADGVYAFDYDTEASAMAHRAAEEAGAAVTVWTGSWDSCRAGWASGVCANLPGGLLREVVADLVRMARPAGWLILSGILDEQQEGIAAALRDAGVEQMRWRGHGEWRAVTGRRRG